MPELLNAAIIYERKFEGSYTLPNGYIYVGIIRIVAALPMGEFHLVKSMGIAGLGIDPFHDEITFHYEFPDQAAADRYGEKLYSDIEAVMITEMAEIAAEDAAALAQIEANPRGASTL